MSKQIIFGGEAIRADSLFYPVGSFDDIEDIEYGKNNRRLKNAYDIIRATILEEDAHDARKNTLPTIKYSDIVPQTTTEVILPKNGKLVDKIKYVELKYLINNYNNFMNMVIDVYNGISKDYNKGFNLNLINLVHNPIILDETYVPNYSFVDDFHKLLITNADEIYYNLLPLLNIPKFEVKSCK